MRLAFAAGDVGGARALLPVARAAHDDPRYQVAALAHGPLQTEGDADWLWLNAQELAFHPVDALLYATSVMDRVAYDLAARMHKQGVPIVHVLDNWSNYASRMEGIDGRAPLIPNAYAVMDDLAYREALAESVPAEILHITGHPNLAQLSDERALYQGAVSEFSTAHLLFVSEPAVADSGPAQARGSRGYDEITVTQDFTEALIQSKTPVSEVPPLLIAPHPREDRAQVAARWQACAEHYGDVRGSPLHWSMVAPGEVRAALHQSQAVVGMSSILLYEAWLLGKRVASLQPGLQGTQLRTLERRKGLMFCDHAKDIPTTVQHLLDPAAPAGQGHSDMAQHGDASASILTLARQLVTANSS